MKVKVNVEEHLVRTIEYEYPDNVDVGDAMEEAEERTKAEYFQGRIVLDADDFTTRLMEVEAESSNGITLSATEWNEF